MGNENNFEVTRNEFDNNKTNLSNKAPEFYINKSYPIHGNKSLKDIIRNYIDGKVDSFEINNTNALEDKNLLTPTFNSKRNFKTFEVWNLSKNDNNNKDNNENKEEFEKNNNDINMSKSDED